MVRVYASRLLFMKVCRMHAEGSYLRTLVVYFRGIFMLHSLRAGIQYQMILRPTSQCWNPRNTTGPRCMSSLSKVSCVGSFLPLRCTSKIAEECPSRRFTRLFVGERIRKTWYRPIECVCTCCFQTTTCVNVYKPGPLWCVTSNK